MISRAVMPTRRSRTWVFLWIALFLMGILLQYGVALSLPSAVLGASGLQAATVHGFEIDGELLSGNGASNPAVVPDGPPPVGEDDLVGNLTNGDDWLQGAGGSNVVSLPSTSTSHAFLYTDAVDPGDTSAYGGGNKEDDTRDWVYVNSAGPNPKTDFKHVMAHVRPSGSSAFVYFGAERLVNNGTLVVDFELNKKPFKQYSVGPLKPDRSAGDLLISLEYSNGGDNPIVTLYRITNVTDYASGQTVDFTKVSDAATAAAVNSATNFIDLDPSGFGYAVPSFDFAEASIDLDALGIQTSCPGFSTGHIRSRTGGDPGSSQLKDAAPHFPIDLNNCGRLRIVKRAGSENGPLLGGSEYTINPDPRPGRDPDQVIIKDNDQTDNAAQAGDQDGTAGQLEIDPAKPDSYTVCETKAPVGYKLPSDPCQTHSVSPNDTYTFTFVDQPKVAATTLTKVQYSPLDGSFVAVGDPISLNVRESNVGESILTNVHVTGTNSCATTGTTAGHWVASATKVGGGAFTGTLSPAEAVDFTCSFQAPADNTFSWSALGHGTDEKGDPAPATNEDESGSYDILMPATLLTVVQDAPAKVHAGDSITIIVNEKNDGEGTISNVTVTGVKSCSDWTAAQGFSGSLAAGASVQFSCTFNALANDFTWEADGHGTDALGHPVPSAGEHVQGNVDVVKPATELTLKGSVPAKVHAGEQVTITVTETNTGDGTLHDVAVVGEGGVCATWTAAANKNGGAGAFSGSLAAGQSVDFSCTFTAPANGDDVTWSALGTGKDSLNAAAPEANERQGGAIVVIKPATTLSIKTNAPAKVHAGAAITIVVTEANTGDDALSAVHVDGGGSCATWIAAANKNGGGIFIGALGAGESVDFTCSFNAPADGTDVTWSADGKGTDSLNTPAPTAGEHQQGAIVVIKPATTLTLVSATPPTILESGTTVITVRETNTGDDTLTAVNVVNLDGDSDCTAGWAASATKVGGGAFSGSLAPGQAVDFSCTITAGTADVIWNALGRGTDSLGTPAPVANEDEAGLVHVVNPDIDIVKTAGANLDAQVADGAVYTTLDGSTVVYKYVVTTLDPDGLTAVQVTDDICLPVTYMSGDNGDGKLVPGESWIFRCVENLNIADDGADVHNIGTASGQPVLGGRVDETDPADVHLRHPAVTIDKDEDDADDLVFPGQVVTYTLTLHVTDGPTDLVVTDDLPTGVTYVPDSASDDGSYAAGVITWNLSDVATGTKKLTYQVTVVAESGLLENEAEACVPAFNGFAAVCDPAKDVVRVPGLSIIKAVSEADHVVARGQKVSYTITVNVTDGPFTDAVITDTLPDGQALVSGTAKSSPAASKITEGVRTIIWEFASLNGTATLTYDVTIDADAPNGPQKNVAVVCVAELEGCTDAAVTIRVPSLTILKDLTDGNTAGSDPDLGPLAKVGDTLTYTLTYTLTDGPVTNAVITDPIRPGLQYVADSASDGGSLIGADAAGNGGTVTWNLGTIEEDGAYTVTYQVKVLASAVNQTQPIVNVATVVSDETPPDDDDATVGVNPPPSVASPTPTLPSTDTPGTGGGTSGGSGLALILLLAVGILGGIGLLAPAPARRRMRDRD